MAKRTLHFNKAVNISPGLEGLIAVDPSEQTTIDLFYIEQRKMLRQQIAEAHNTVVKRTFDITYTLKSGTQFTMTSKVVKAIQGDVFIETTAMSMAEYAEITRQIILPDYTKRQPPLQ